MSKGRAGMFNQIQFELKYFMFVAGYFSLSQPLLDLLIG